jgi:hypothetical protein
MPSLQDTYSDLRFTPSQLYFSDEEYREISRDFFGNSGPDTLTNRDRAFLQAALFIAVDKSEKASLLFDIYRSFVSSAPSRSIIKLAQKLATTGAKHAYSQYIDNDPKYSAVGRAAIQYSGFSTHWRVRIGTGDTSLLPSFLSNGT